MKKSKKGQKMKVKMLETPLHAIHQTYWSLCDIIQLVLTRQSPSTVHHVTWWGGPSVDKILRQGIRSVVGSIGQYRYIWSWGWGSRRRWKKCMTSLKRRDRWEASWVLGHFERRADFRSQGYLTAKNACDRMDATKWMQYRISTPVRSPAELLYQPVFGTSGGAL